MSSMPLDCQFCTHDSTESLESVFKCTNSPQNKMCKASLQINPIPESKTDGISQTVEGRDTYKTALPPIQQLPAELLEAIFDLAIHDESQDTPGANAVGRLRPWKLGLVCRHWWEIVRADAGLWTHCQIDLRKFFSLERRAILQAQLWRSNPRPLTIDLPQSSGYITTHCFWNTLKPHLHRISVFRICATLLVAVADSSPGPICMPALRELRVYLPEPKSSIVQNHYDLRRFTDRFQPSTELQYVVIERFWLFCRIAHFSRPMLPWRQLRVLRASFVDGQSVLEMFQQAEALEECYILSGPRRSQLMETIDASITLHRLKTLEFHFEPRILSFLVTPALQRLSVPSNCEYDQIKPLLRSSCNLTALELPVSESTTSELIDLLAALPYLRSLTCDPVHGLFPPEFEKVFVERDSSFLPRLQHIRIINIDVAGGAMLLRALEARSLKNTLVDKQSSPTSSVSLFTVYIAFKCDCRIGLWMAYIYESTCWVRDKACVRLAPFAERVGHPVGVCERNIKDFCSRVFDLQNDAASG